MVKKLFIFLFIGLFLFSFVNAGTSDPEAPTDPPITIIDWTKNTIPEADWTWDNVADYSPEIKDGYYGGEYLIKDSFLGIPTTKVKTVSLKSNTETCTNDCEARFNITTFKDTQLVDSEGVLFYRLEDGKDPYLSNIRSYQLYVKSAEGAIKETPIYNYVCYPTGEYSENGTAIEVCGDEFYEILKEPMDEWIPYNYEVVPAGNYEVKLVGEKRPDWTYDWQIVTSGTVTTEWAVWGATIGVGGVTASVTLNSPANNSIQYTTIVITNASANVTGGATLVNATLYDNSTGTWGARNTTNILAFSDIISYYTLDETSGTTAFDLMSRYNATNIGATVNQAGKIGTAYDFEASESDKLNTTIPITNSFSYSFWIKPESLTSYQAIMSSGNLESWIGVGSSGQIRVHLSGGAYADTANSIISTGSWQHVVVTWNGTLVIKVNNASIGYTTTGSLTNPAGSTLNIGWSAGGSPNYFDGLIDEILIENRSLTATEISSLYNNGNGARITTTTTTTTFTNTYPSGSNIKWNMKFCDSDGACGFATSNRTFSIDSTAPNITLNYPTSLINYGANNGTLQLNFTATDTNLANCSYIYDPLTNTTLADGKYLVDISTTLKDIGYIYVENNVTQRFRIVAPIATEVVPNLRIYYNTTNNSAYQEFNPSALNTTLAITVPNGWHLVQWQSGYYGSFGGSYGKIDLFSVNDTYFVTSSPTTNAGKYTNVSCSSGTPVLANITLGIGKKVEIRANDTAGNLNTTTFSWDYKVFENSISYTPITLEGSASTIFYNFTTTLANIESSTLYLNGNSYAMSVSQTGNNLIVSSSFEAPLVDSITNKTFYVLLRYSTEDIYSNNYSIQILPTDIAICNATINNTVINISVRDETTKSLLTSNNITASLYWIIGDNNLGTTYLTMSNTSSYRLCSTQNLTAYETIYLAGKLVYYGSGYAIEEYNFDETQVSSKNITNISLYLLNSSIATRYLLEVKDANALFLSNVIVRLYRIYQTEANTTLVVEAPLTNTEGGASLYAISDSERYNIGIFDLRGTLLQFFDNYVFTCDNPLTSTCRASIKLDVDPRTDVSLSQLYDILFYDPVVLSDGTVSISYTIPSGTASNIKIKINQVDMFGNSTPCENTVYSAGGTLSCTYDPAIGESKIQVQFYKDDLLLLQKGYAISDDAEFEGNNFLIVIVLLLSLIGMAFSSPEWIIVNAVAVFLIAGSLWLLSGMTLVVGLGGLAWLVIAGGILLKKLAER